MAIDDGRPDGGGGQDLDEMSHAELRLLYRDASQTVRFAKERQWRLTGGTLLIFAGMMLLPEILALSALVGKALVLSSFLVSASAIYILVIYQVWQSAELRRMQEIGARFSTIFLGIGGDRVRRDSALHGYIIAFFMIGGILLANGVTVLVLLPLYR